MTVVEDFFRNFERLYGNAYIHKQSFKACLYSGGGVFNCLINNDLALFSSNIYRLGTIRVSRTLSLFAGK